MNRHVLLVSPTARRLTPVNRSGKNPGFDDTNMAMTLSTVPSSAAAPFRVNGVTAGLGALVCASSAGVHAALVLPHGRESMAMAVAFGVAAGALALAAVAQVVGPTATTSAAVAVLLLGVAVAYVLSRTTGILGLTAHPEPFDTLGVVVSSMEAATALVLGRQLLLRRS